MEENPLRNESEMTFCLIKPHAAHAGFDGEIVSFLQRNKFSVLESKRIMFTDEIVKELFRDRVVPDKELESWRGAGVFIHLTKKNAIEDLRKLIGHDVPAEARIGTLHYMYGMTPFYNSVIAPKNESEFERMYEVLNVWYQVFARALTDREGNPLERASKRLEAMFGTETQEPEPIEVPSASGYIIELSTGSFLESMNDKEVIEVLDSSEAHVFGNLGAAQKDLEFARTLQVDPSIYADAEIHDVDAYHAHKEQERMEHEKATAAVADSYINDSADGSDESPGEGDGMEDRQLD